MALVKQLGIGVGAGFLMSGVLLLAAESFFPSLTVVPGTLERRIPPALALIGGSVIGGGVTLATFLLSSQEGEDDSPLARGWRNSGQVSRGQIVMDPLTATSIYIDSHEEEEEKTEKEKEDLEYEDESLNLEHGQEIGIRSIEWVPGEGSTAVSFPVIQHPETQSSKESGTPKQDLVQHPQKTASGTFSDLW